MTFFGFFLVFECLSGVLRLCFFRVIGFPGEKIIAVEFIIEKWIALLLLFSFDGSIYLEFDDEIGIFQHRVLCRLYG